MKTKVQSFSFLMELIIVIFFFALSSTVCVSLIGKAKEKQNLAEDINKQLLMAQTVIETMQAYPTQTPDLLFDAKKKDEYTYEIDDLIVRFQNNEMKNGVVQIYSQETLLKEFPFVLGGKNDE